MNSTNAVAVIIQAVLPLSKADTSSSGASSAEVVSVATLAAAAGSWAKMPVGMLVNKKPAIAKSKAGTPILYFSFMGFGGFGSWVKANLLLER